MQINGILFLVLVGAIAVLAKKGSSEEKNGYEVLSVWPYPRPSGSVAFGKHKFKHPKHQSQIYFVPRPEYQQQGYPSQTSQFQGVTSIQIQEFLFNVQKQMQEFSVKAYKEFQLAEAEIDRTRQNAEDILKSQFQTMELALISKQAKEVQQAVKDGKDEKKIKDCLAKEEQEFRREVDADIERTRDCLNDATERSRKIVSDARNSFTETSVTSAIQMKDWAQRMNSCVVRQDMLCMKEGVSLINDRTKYTIQEGNLQMGKLQGAPRQQIIQISYCSENFVQDMKEMRDLYSKVVKRCVIASEIQDPESDDEDDDDEEDDSSDVGQEEKMKVQVNAEAEVSPV